MAAHRRPTMADFKPASPVEMVEAAASRLEKLLDVGDGPHGSWHVHEEPPYFVVRDGAGYAWLYSDTGSRAAVDYAAAVSPAVGAALVLMLRAWTGLGVLDRDLLHRVGGPATVRLARAILGQGDGWRPASPGDTPGELLPGEHDRPEPVDLPAVTVTTRYTVSCANCGVVARTGEPLEADRRYVAHLSEHQISEETPDG